MGGSQVSRKFNRLLTPLADFSLRRLDPIVKWIRLVLPWSVLLNPPPPDVLVGVGRKCFAPKFCSLVKVGFLFGQLSIRDGIPAFFEPTAFHKQGPFLQSRAIALHIKRKAHDEGVCFTGDGTGHLGVSQ